MPRETLESLLKLNLPISTIATNLQVSRPLIYKAITAYGLNGSRYSEIEQNQLEQIVSQIKQQHSNAGEVMLQGHLENRGVHVQRERVRNAIHSVDPSVSSRKCPPINRRVYSVPCPNYLWHIDGNHKMIRRGFVIHHAIDGFTRLITFCKCSTNNKSTTVFPLFQEAIQTYGRPIHVRTDLGGENVLIWRNMESFWGEEARSVIVGSSVHNQRIERHNRAVNEQVISMFKAEFYDLEIEGILDPLNSMDIFCLHYVYLPRVQKTLHEFVEAHNNHRLSTENNKTPTQLFWLNFHLYHLHCGNQVASTRLNGVCVQSLLSSQIQSAEVPEFQNPLSDLAYHALQNDVDPLLGLDGKIIYRRVIQFVARQIVGSEVS